KLSAIIDHEKEYFDPWKLSSQTRTQQDVFKSKLVVFYHRQSTTLARGIKCMVLDYDLSSDYITAAHIWPSSTNGRGLSRFRLEAKCLNDSRNGLLLHKSIEQGFDRKQICFLYDLNADQLKTRLLCPSIRFEQIDNGITFGDIDGRPLQLPKGVWPYRRLLNWHVIRSFEYAREESWIDSSECVEDYFHMSDPRIEMPG
ncbi:unnamed protein product, partial [Didymodactylos carnosus]